MCQQLVEKYSCGDQEKATFPCEDLLTQGTCSKPEDDKIIDHADTKCRDCQQMDDALKQIAEDARLAPEPRTGGGPETGDPNAPKRYFIEYIKWSKCGHISHPKWTDIERFDSGPELGFEIGGMGRCHACSEADPATLAHMERTGELALPDPWGAMKHEPEVAAGSSGAGGLDSDSDNEYPSTEAIALNITNSALKDLRAGTGAAGHMGPAASSSAKSAAAVNAGRQAMGDIVSAPPSPEFDTSAHKGKARRGHPEETYGSRFGAASHDADDDEEREEPPYYSDEGSDSFSPPPHSHRHPHPPLDNEETDHEEGGARNHHHRSSHHSRPDLNHGRPPFTSQSDDDDDDDEEGGGAEGSAKPNAGRDDHDADGDEDAEIEISQSERARLAIPRGFRLTKKGLARFEERREMAGREAMRRQREGSDDGEE